MSRKSKLEKIEVEIDDEHEEKKKKGKKKSLKDIIKDYFLTHFFDEDDNVEEDNVEVEVAEKKQAVKASPKRFTTFEFVVVSFLLLVFGIVIGCFITMGTRAVLGYRVDDEVASFVQVYNYVKENYYEDVDDKELMKAAISGMLKSLGDEYSYFMDETSTENFNTDVNGTYNGVGITIRTDEESTKIISVFEGSPAAKAKVKPDDVVLKVNGQDVSGKDSSEIADMISNKLGDKIVLVVKRGEEELTFNLTVSAIEIPSVSSEIKEQDNKKIGYISISNFAANTASQFEKELKKVEKEKIDSLILDVRGNTGGALSQVHKMLELFFDKKTVLYQIETKGKKVKYYSKTNDKRSYPVVILTNSLSASASEVLASCFKDNYKNATIVGTTTYGKGTVQKALEYKDGTSFKFTAQKWLTPKGKWIHEKGVKPDVEVKNESTEEDTQLLKAIELLTKKES